MLNPSRNPIPIVILGAGPYGLSLASHLRSKGVPFRAFGQPMQTWAKQMPAGMRLKSAAMSSDLSTGGQPYTFASFCEQTGRPSPSTEAPSAVEDFAAYGQEFARRCVPTLESEDIRAIERADDLFRVTTASGEKIFARRVVVATGLSGFQHMPSEFRHLPSARVTHAAQHRSFEGFAGRDVTVLGRGASALQTAVLLHEAGAQVTLIARGRKLQIQRSPSAERRSLVERVLRPESPLGQGLRPWLASAAPGLLHLCPTGFREALLARHETSEGEASLRSRVSGFNVLLGARIHAVEPADGSGSRLRISLTDAQGNVHQHLTSHLFAGTGYRVKLERLRFLSHELRELLQVDRGGAPLLNRNFEASVRGLHLIGPVAAAGFGPLLSSIAGAKYAAERLSLHLQRSWLRERSAAPRQEMVPLRAVPHREQVPHGS